MEDKKPLRLFKKTDVERFFEFKKKWLSVKNIVGVLILLFNLLQIYLMLTKGYAQLKGGVMFLIWFPYWYIALSTIISIIEIIIAVKIIQSKFSVFPSFLICICLEFVIFLL